MQNARGKSVEHKCSFICFDGVSRIWSAVIAQNHIGVLRKHINNFSFSSVPPPVIGDNDNTAAGKFETFFHLPTSECIEIVSSCQIFLDTSNKKCAKIYYGYNFY